MPTEHVKKLIAREKKMELNVSKMGYELRGWMGGYVWDDKNSRVVIQEFNGSFKRSNKAEFFKFCGVDFIEADNGMMV